MKVYKALNKQTFSVGHYTIVPIRYEDRFEIMKWRNEQIYHLRQDKPLTIETQENYFNNVISELFEQDKPNQILFSYMENEVCIGYGGMVHINWIDKNAEISFIMNTHLEKEFFHNHWNLFLNLIEKVAFAELNFHKIFVYAFDLRRHLYIALKNSGYIEDARLTEHCLIKDNFTDVLIYSKFHNL